MHQNYILDTSNAALNVTNFFGLKSTNTLTGLPLGALAGSATGELGVKVHVLSGAGGLAPATAVNTPAILTSGGDVIAATPTRKSATIQNLGMNPLFVRLGTGASSTVFNYILKAGTANDDGTGGSITLSGTDWTGIISATGTSPRLVVTQTT